MTGTIISYDASTGQGLLTAEGRQYEFNTSMWRESVAPAPNQTVSFALNGSTPINIRIVAGYAPPRPQHYEEPRQQRHDHAHSANAGMNNIGRDAAANMQGAGQQAAASMKDFGQKAAAGMNDMGQKAAAGMKSFGDKAAGSMNDLGSKAMGGLKDSFENVRNMAGNNGLNFAESDNPFLRSLESSIGVTTAIAYAVFFVSSLFLQAVAVNVFGAWTGASLYDILAKGAEAGFGNYHILLIIAWVSVFVPLVWKDRKAYLSYLLPVVVFIAIGVAAHDMVSGVKSQLGGLTGGMPLFSPSQAKELSQLWKLSFGCYLAIGSALYLGAVGVRRFSAR